MLDIDKIVNQAVAALAPGACECPDQKQRRALARVVATQVADRVVHGVESPEHQIPFELAIAMMLALERALYPGGVPAGTTNTLTAFVEEAARRLGTPPPQFGLTAEQHARADEFCKANNVEGGGPRTYTFTPVGVGTVEKVVAANGQVLDLTDYDGW